MLKAQSDLCWHFPKEKNQSAEQFPHFAYENENVTDPRISEPSMVTSKGVNKY